MTDTIITTVYSDENKRKPMCTVIGNLHQVEISANIEETGILKLRFVDEDGAPRKLFIRQEQY